MAVPVVANREVLDQRRVIEESGGGLSPAYQPMPFAAAITELLGDADEADRRGRAGRQWVERHRDYRVLTERLVGHYERYVIPPGPGP